MDKAAVLVSKHGVMMRDFSSRSVRHLKNHLALRLLLSVFEHFLDANVAKEVEKEKLIIKRAVAAFAAGKGKSQADVDAAFEEGRRIDSEFISSTPASSVKIEIRYEEIAGIRKKRIACIRDAVFDLLQAWEEEASFPAVVKGAFSEQRFAEVILEILHLYNMETKIVGSSVDLHGPAGKLKDVFAGRLYGAMEDASKEIAAEYTRKIYSEGEGTCAIRT